MRCCGYTLEEQYIRRKPRARDEAGVLSKNSTLPLHRRGFRV